MPTFILRNLDPHFWSKVQAKAKADATTVKAVILKLLAQWLGVFAVLLLASSCTKPYVAPPLGPSTLPANTPPPTSTPAPSAQPLIVTLSVGVAEPNVGDSISFVASTATTITHAEWAFGNGATQSTPDGQTAYAYPAVGTFDAKVTVTASDGRTGSDHRTVTVRKKQTTPTPDPTPTPTPTGPKLTAELTCTPKPALTPTPCNVTASYGGAVLPSSQTTQVVWDFGDGPPPVTTPGPVVSHAYPQPGSYTVFATVTATTSDGSKTVTVTKTLTIP